jgi:multicomponent Na+:H+ antiporter subunit C
MIPGDLVAAPTVNLVMALTVGVLYTVGFYLMLQRSLMRVLLGVVVLGHGTNLLLQLVGGPPARVPIVGHSPPETFADPLPQALALTAVVITFALTTFLLALGYRSFTLIGHDERAGRRGGPPHRAHPAPGASLETGGDDDRDGRSGTTTRATTAIGGGRRDDGPAHPAGAAADPRRGADRRRRDLGRRAAGHRRDDAGRRRRGRGRCCW